MYQLDFNKEIFISRMHGANIKLWFYFPLLTEPEGSFLCSKESVILLHSDPHEQNPQPHFGNRGLTNYTLC